MADSSKYVATVQGSAKAWFNFDGTGTVALEESLNVSSLVDNGTGDYTINLNSPMSSANFVFTTGRQTDTATGGTPNYYGTRYVSGVLTELTASAHRMIAKTQDGVQADHPRVCMQYFGDLA